MNRKLGSSLEVWIALGLAVATTACGGSSSEGSSPPGNQQPGDGGTGGDGSPAGGEGGAGADAGPPPGVFAIPLIACEAPVYAANINIGTQEFSVLVDTGSTTLSVAGQNCSNCGVAPVYVPGSSATDQKEPAQSQFGSGSWQGEVYKDSVGFASDPTVQMDFVSISSQTSFFSGNCGGKPYTGLMGFDRPGAAAAQGAGAFFDQFYAGQGIANIFATELCYSGGTLWLGGYDPAATTAAPQYTPFTSDIDSTYYYTVSLASVTVGSTTVPIPTATQTDAVLDTGTSIFIVPDAALSALGSAIKADPGFQKTFSNASSWFAPGGQQCDPSGMGVTQKAALDAALPPITLTFGSNPGIQVKAVATESYLEYIPPVQGQGGWCAAMINDPTGQLAKEGIASIVGSPVLRSSVVIFDRANNRAGFAPHTPCN